jgi:hypothetical protein
MFERLEQRLHIFLRVVDVRRNPEQSGPTCYQDGVFVLKPAGYLLAADPFWEFQTDNGAAF